MRIVHLVIGGEVAGGQLVALRLARAAQEAGHRVSFVAPEAGAFTALAEQDGFPVELLPISGALDVRAALRLRRHLRRERADVLHLHTMLGGNVVGRVAGRAAGVRAISHLHIENVFRAGPGRALQIRLDNATARLCAHIVAVSDATRAALLTQGYPAGRTVTIRNGVEPGADVEPVRLADGPTILEVARLADVKGQRELVAALAQVPGATAVLVGRDLESGGAFERELIAEAERLGVDDRVVLTGYRADVPALLAGCDVFCLPSHAEGLPLVILEAMAHGKPVVATAVGGTPELVVDGETGLLVTPGDVEALAAALSAVLADPELANRLGEAGRKRVLERFSAADAAARVLALYAA